MKKNYKKLLIIEILVTSTIIIFPPVLLVPFGALVRLFTPDEFNIFLHSPASFLIILINMGIVSFLSYMIIKKTSAIESPDWNELRKMGILLCILFFVYCSLDTCYLNFLLFIIQ